MSTIKISLDKLSPTPSPSLLPRRRKLLLLLGLPLAFLLYICLFSPRHPPPRQHHPFHISSGRLVYDKQNPFVTDWVEKEEGKGDWFGFGPGKGGRAGRKRANPRLMEKLMMRMRGEEEIVQEAYGEAKMGSEERGLGEEERDELEWLKGRTVVLLGDSIDRYHLLHFCQFLALNASLNPLPWPKGEPEDFVTVHYPDISSHPTSSYPPEAAQAEEDIANKYRSGKAFGSKPSRPWTCRVEAYDFEITNLFLFGGDEGASTPGPEEWLGGNMTTGGGEGTWGQRAKDEPFGAKAFYPIESEHFNPPLSAEDRLHDILLPLLKNRGREHVDLVELGVGGWDLGMFRSQDVMATKSFLTQNPSYPANVSTLASNITSLPLSPARIDWFSHRLSSILSTIHSAFPPVVPSFSQSQPPSPPHLRIGHPHAAPPAPVSPRPPLYDRALSRIHVHPMHVTPQWYKYPWVFDRVRIAQIHDAVKEVVQSFSSQRHHALEDSQQIRYSPWADLVRGVAEHVALDHIHPAPIPSSWIWADWMLYELRRVVSGEE